MASYYEGCYDDLRNVTYPRDTDVLYERGVAVSSHPGNQTHQQIVDKNKRLLITWNTSENEILNISWSIVTAIRQQNGRFLEWDAMKGTWFDIGNNKAIEKTSQALCEGQSQPMPMPRNSNQMLESGQISQDGNTRFHYGEYNHRGNPVSPDGLLDNGMPVYAYAPVYAGGGQVNMPPPPPPPGYRMSSGFHSAKEQTVEAMVGKRGTVRDNVVDNSRPRKRHRKEEGGCRVRLNYYTNNVRVDEIVDFINRHMEREFYSSIGRDGAIVNYHTYKDGKGWILEAASTDLAKKVCILNGIYYKYHPLKIRLYGDLSSRSNRCYNDYCLKRYGKNALFVDHHILATVLKSKTSRGTRIDGLKLQSKLNEKMEEFKLSTTNAITETVKVNSEDNNDRFLLNMRTQRDATRLTYLNHICIDNFAIILERLPEWKGEEPTYKHYEAFLKDHGPEEEEKQADQKQVHGQSMDRPNMEMQSRSTGGSDVKEEAEYDPFADSEEESEKDGPAPTIFEESSLCGSTPGSGNEFEREPKEHNPTANTATVQKNTILAGDSTGNGAETSTQDDYVAKELASKPAAVEKPASVIRSSQNGEELQHATTTTTTTTANNGSMKAIIAEQTAKTKALRASLETANGKLTEKDERIAQLEKIVEEQKKTNLEKTRESMEARMKLVSEKLAQKDDRIAELEKIVQDQQKDIEEERRKVSSKEAEVVILRENYSSLKTDLEGETARLHGEKAALSKELESTVMKLDAVHQSWGNQTLMLEAKDKQIAVLEARLEKIRDAFFWQPDVKESPSCKDKS